MKIISSMLVFFILSCLSIGTQGQKTTCSSYKLSFYTQKAVEVYIAGKEVAYKVRGGISSISVQKNTCEDIVFVLKNEELAAPVALSAIMESGDDMYATSVFIKGNSTDDAGVWSVKYAHVKFAEQGDVKPLFGLSLGDFHPKNLTDFSVWKPNVIVDSVLKENYEYFGDFRVEGAFPVHWSDGPMKLGKSAIKICNPLNSSSADAQTVVSACYK